MFISDDPFESRREQLTKCVCGLGPVQTSNFTCAEPNTYLGRVRHLIKTSNNKIKSLRSAVTDMNPRGFDMAEFSENRARNNSEEFLIANAIREGNRMRLNMQMALNHLVARRRRVLNACFLVLLFISSQRNNIIPVSRSCRRWTRNTACWVKAWNSYSEERFKKTFRISRSTFRYILNRIGPFVARETVIEDPISPELRLALCLYRLCRGDYLYTIAEMAGVGVSTVCLIVNEVCQVLVDHLWSECVSSPIPKTQDDFKKKILDMDEFWLFPCCWAAIDGCHIPIKCPPGGLEACKEYHNFKNFYSIVLMGLVDSHFRFVRGSEWGGGEGVHMSVVG